MSRPLTLLPAVDVSAGRASQVVDDSSTDPYAVATAWVDQGAPWVHLVDLDLAYGRGNNADLLAGLVAALPVPVQLSGGIADERTLQTALDSGAERVNLAAGALRDPAWVRQAVRRHGSRIAVGLDLRGGEVVARGSSARLGALEEVLRLLDGCGARTYVVADASRDGSRLGADAALFGAVARLVGGEVIASGGVGTLEDVARLRTLTEVGVVGAVLGSALYHRAFRLADALRVAAEVPA